MKKNIIFLAIVCLSLLSFVSALEEIGYYSKGECVNISEMCSTCSYVNISSISTNSNSNLVLNAEMTYLQNGEWRYEFCDTDEFGRYDVKGQGDINGVNQSFATYFVIDKNGTGDIQTGSSLILIMALLIMLLFAGFFIMLSFKVTNGTFILIFFGIASVVLFMATLFSMSLIDNLMTQYDFIVDGYTSYFMVFKIILSMSMLSLVLYAGYRALMLWKMKRGLIDDD